MNDGLVFLLVITPHIVLGAAWVSWGLSPVRFQPPRWRTIFLLSGLVACSLNLAILWACVIWLKFRQNDQFWWKGIDKFEAYGVCLIGFATLAAVLGKGRERPLVLIVAVTGFLIWAIGHHGIL
jgi:hypothetical protein